MNKNYAYCRVSTNKQDAQKQELQLLSYAQKNRISLDEIVLKTVSSKKSRKERDIDSLLDQMSRGDTLFITKLDRLGRNTREVLEIIEDLKNRGIILVVVQDSIKVDPNDTNPITTMYLTMLSAFAQMERDFISERTKMGLIRAREEGRLPGKKKGTISSNTQFEKDKEKIKEYLELKLSYKKIVAALGYGSKGALYSFVRNRKGYFGI